MDEDRLTPDEMKAAGVDRLTPAEMRGRVYAQPREHSDDELGLRSGPVESVSPFSPRAQTPSGALGLGPSFTQDPGEYAKSEQVRSAPTDPLQVDPILQAMTAYALAEGSAAPLRLLAPTGDVAGAELMAKGAAFQRARNGLEATKLVGGHSMLPAAANFLLGHNPLLHLALKGTRFLPAAGRAAGAAAGPLGANAAVAGEAVMTGDRGESPEQRAARVLLGGIDAPIR